MSNLDERISGLLVEPPSNVEREDGQISDTEENALLEPEEQAHEDPDAMEESWKPGL